MTQKVRLLTNCSVAAGANTGAVVMAASCEVSKKKEEARKVLYLTRI